MRTWFRSLYLVAAAHLLGGWLIIGGSCQHGPHGGGGYYQPPPPPPRGVVYHPAPRQVNHQRGGLQQCWWATPYQQVCRPL